MAVRMSAFLFLILGLLVGKCCGQNGEPIIYNDCVEALQKDCNTTAATYNIKVKTNEGYIPTQCQRSAVSGKVNCPGDGWTYVGRAPFAGPSVPNTAPYSSSVWAARNESDLNNIFTPHHWSANVTEICLRGFFLSVHVTVVAPSLRSLFVEGETLVKEDIVITTGSQEVPVPSFKEGCYEAGFNIGTEGEVLCRFGIISKDNQGCNIASLSSFCLGYKVPGTEGSFHGIYKDGKESFHAFDVLVRSQPWPESVVP